MSIRLCVNVFVASCANFVAASEAPQRNVVASRSGWLCGSHDAGGRDILGVSPFRESFRNFLRVHVLYCVIPAIAFWSVPQTVSARHQKLEQHSSAAFPTMQEADKATLRSLSAGARHRGCWIQTQL